MSLKKTKQWSARYHKSSYFSLSSSFDNFIALESIDDVNLKETEGQAVNYDKLMLKDIQISINTMIWMRKNKILNSKMGIENY
jgi:hypothetical protein